MLTSQIVGEEVINKQSEIGVINSIDDFIHVGFIDRECLFEKDAFEKGYLRFINKDINQKIVINKTQKENKEVDNRIEVALKELNSLVGLEKVKEKVNDLVCQIKIANIRKSLGLKVPDNTNHMVFLGNPGTGKTTVARIIAKIYKELGILSNGHLLEVDRSQLVAAYQGQTAIKTMKALKNALGGVLFIDEAYALCRGKDDDYGLEALDTIVKFMEDHRDNLVVVVAGYEKEMIDFINANPGLSSRFKTFIAFDDYNGEELFQIFNDLFIDNDYSLSKEAKEYAKHYLKDNHLYSNGRDIRNMFEMTISKQARRLNQLTNINKKDLINIQKEDLCFS